MRQAQPRVQALRVVAIAGTLILLAACTRVLPPDAHPSLGVVNGTTMTVTLFVNGQKIADYTPGQYPPTQQSSSIPPGPPIDENALPVLPWAVEVRSPSGRVLDSASVAPGEVKVGSAVGGTTVTKCGKLGLWVGTYSPQLYVDPVPQPSEPSPDPALLAPCAP